MNVEVKREAWRVKSEEVKRETDLACLLPFVLESGKPPRFSCLTYLTWSEVISYAS